MRTAQLISIFTLVLSLPGCVKDGPKTLRQDRIAYGDAMSQSWKEQMLLNVVRLRYGDTPIFLDPTSIISQVATIHEGDVTLTGTASIPTALSASNVGGTIFGRSIVESRPTITYTPLTGDRFTRSMLTPLPPHVVLEYAQAGYPVEFVFRTMLFSVNGLANQRSVGLLKRDPDPRFVKVLELLGELQRKGSLSTRLERREKGEVAVLVIRKEQDEPPAATELRQLLGLEPDATELNIVYGTKPMAKNELALLTRSLNDVLFEFAGYIEIPERDVNEGRALPAIKLSPELEKSWPPLIRIHCSTTQPTDVMTTIQYRNRWFYIDDTDVASKRMFSFMMFLITLAESGTNAAVPQVTIPVR